MDNQQYIEKIKNRIYDLMENVPKLINSLILLDKFNFDSKSFYDLDGIDHALSKAKISLNESEYMLSILCSDLAPTKKQIEFGKKIDEILNKSKSPMFCDHANECPNICPCEDDCYCKLNTCKKE